MKVSLQNIQKEKSSKDRKYQNICSFCSYIIVESRTTKRHILKNYKVLKKKIKVLPLTYTPYLDKPKKIEHKKKI